MSITVCDIDKAHFFHGIMRLTIIMMKDVWFILILVFCYWSQQPEEWSEETHPKHH